MTITDPISDMFTRIRNALGSSHRELLLPHSVIKEQIAAILLNEGFITAVSVLDVENNKKYLKITLKYFEKKPLIKQLLRKSKPSKRIYVKKRLVPKVLNGFGVSIISTSKGILSGREARLNNVGGELIGIVS
jgi:small subunit ribosomal protein S8